MNKQSNDTRTPLLLHAARLVFPPLAALVVLVLTEWIARGTLDADTFAQYIEPHWEAYALAWALLFLVWLTVDWLTRFAPLATLVTAILGCVPAAVDFYTLQLRGEPFLPWDLMQVSEAAGVASAAGIHIQTSMIVSIVVVLVLPLPEAGKAGLASAGGRLYRQRGSRLRAGVLRLFAVRRDGEPWHPAGRLDAGPLLPLLWRHHQLSDQPDQSGN